MRSVVLAIVMLAIGAAAGSWFTYVRMRPYMDYQREVDAKLESYAACLQAGPDQPLQDSDAAQRVFALFGIEADCGRMKGVPAYGVDQMLWFAHANIDLRSGHAVDAHVTGALAPASTLHWPGFSGIPAAYR